MHGEAREHLAEARRLAAARVGYPVWQEFCDRLASAVAMPLAGLLLADKTALGTGVHSLLDDAAWEIAALIDPVKVYDLYCEDEEDGDDIGFAASILEEAVNFLGGAERLAGQVFS